MKKILLILLSAFLLTGCVFDKDQDQLLQYKDFLSLLSTNETYVNGSKYFDVSIEMVEVATNEYRYYVFIDDPTVAMYDIKAIVIDPSQVYNDQLMAPSVGLLDFETYNMVPFQSNVESGYVKGLMLSGIKTFDENQEKRLELDILVQWYNENRTVQSREFITVEYSPTDVTVHDEEIEEPVKGDE